MLILQIVAFVAWLVCGHESNRARHARDMSNAIVDADRAYQVWRVANSRVMRWNLFQEFAMIVGILCLSWGPL